MDQMHEIIQEINRYGTEQLRGGVGRLDAENPRVCKFSKEDTNGN